MGGKLGKVCIASVWSGEKAHLIFAIISVFVIAFLEATNVLMFKTFDDTYTVVFVSLFMQGFALIVGFVGVYVYNCYRRRSRFDMFYHKLGDPINVERVKSEFHVCQADNNGIIFVRKEDVEKYRDRELLVNYKNTLIAEKKLFSKAYD